MSGTIKRTLVMATSFSILFMFLRLKQFPPVKSSGKNHLESRDLLQSWELFLSRFLFRD